MKFTCQVFFLSAFLFVSVHKCGCALNPADNCSNAKKVLEILPGRGWDSLQNKDMSQVVRLTYNNCKTTLNGIYLIPDSLSTIPVRETDMQLITELFEHYGNYTSITSHSFNAGLGFPFIMGAVWVAGSFSPEYEEVKNRQILDKAMTTRVYIRNTIYSVRVDPLFELETDFKNRIEDAALEFEQGNAEAVRIAMETLVRDYGTHYQTQVDVGATLVKEDFVKSSYVLKYWSERNQITAAAGVSFLKLVSFGFSYRQTVEKDKAEAYNESIISTTLRTVGGPMIQQNMTEYEWVSQIPNNMATVDRSGDPLYFAIKENNFPNISRDTLKQLKMALQNAVEAYYLYNTHKGCMNMNSPNFDRYANVDDLSCQIPLTNNSFGGLYLNCTSLNEELGNICNELRTNNLLTGNLSCPIGFVSIPLHSADLTKENKRESSSEECSGWWIFKYNCHTVTTVTVLTSKAHYDSYWCAASKNASPAFSTGLLFGGLFTSTNPNPVTKSTSCPEYFRPLSFGADLKVCVSNDFELGFRYSLPFGGFFSCEHGNPLADSFEHKTGNISVFDTSTSPYSQNCPSGFSQHLATLDGGCAINYCLNTGVFDFHDDSFPLHKPPYLKKMIPLQQNSDHSADLRVQSFTTAVIVGIVAAIVGLIVIVAVVWKVRMWRNAKRNSYQHMNNRSEE